MFSTDSFCREYKPDTSDLAIRGKKFSFYVPASIERFIDHENLLHDFPLWSKIWEASLILADYLAGIPVNPEKSFLEIGAGIGVAGITAASLGHLFTITEYDTHALNFLHANAEKNSSQYLPEIVKLDWNKPSLEKVFDYIVASEVVYNEESFQPLSLLLKRYLKPDGEIILTMEIRQTTKKFFDYMQDSYNIKIQKKIMHKKDKDIPVILCKMKLKTACRAD